MAALSPNPILDVSYEALVTDPETQMRAVTEFLDLPWDPACLTPEGATAACVTRSRGEVRGALSARSVGRWRRYGDHVRPLAEALAKQGIACEAPEGAAAGATG